MVNHIFVGIDLGDKNSVARIAVNRDKTERLGFVNDRRGRARLFEEVKRRAEKTGGATIVMAYEASSCGFILCDEAEAQGIACWVVAPTKLEKSLEQRKHKNDDRDAEDLVEKLRGHELAGNRLPTVWIPDRQMRDDRELIRTRTELVDKQTRLKTQIQMLIKRHGTARHRCYAQCHSCPRCRNSNRCDGSHFSKQLSGNERARDLCSGQLRGSLLRNPQASGFELHRNCRCETGPDCG